ncbi:DUF881 domain-containing protein [Thermoanaerobacterium sp. RBIITD]|uniref:DUF881 domain-containing protein n=1 Tax=Thermoanaerobacterium sp. RBIITD TaxID=1550240 RepID=UPI000BB88094|nr:DUF881 domain-containing protein [Thermoanaerobacterium sp. RBIITD]SNX53379.1 Uncharacterized conserved protein YlxW, UPF0749 family [Thermoanaerobacterium sp. RBIITD]
MKGKVFQVVSLVLVFLVMGFMISMQFKTIQGDSKIAAASPKDNSAKVDELTNELKNITNEKNSLQAQVAELNQKLNTLNNSSSKYGATINALTQDVDKYKELAGLTKMIGPGVIVTVNDSDIQPKDGEDPNMFLVHDEDLLKVVNELRAGGAEAISINEQRLIATSEIRCVGPAININSTRYTPPYVIKAIGNPDTLQASLNLKGGIVETLRYYGIKVDIQTSNNIVVPAYADPINLKYAKATK